jgi:hypothetical protein
METSQILYYRSTQMLVGISIYRYIYILHLSGAFDLSLLLIRILWNSVDYKTTEINIKFKTLELTCSC